MIYGYHRTSTREQHLDRGIAAIEEYCQKNNLPLEKIFTDKQTGKHFQRPRYTVMKEDVLREGDCLIISELDRLGRNKQSVLDELRYYQNAGIRVMILEIPTTLIDYSDKDNAVAKMMIGMVNNVLIEVFASFAEAEMEKREKRQREGIAAKKARGEWDDYGRPRAVSKEAFAEEYKKVESGELRPMQCARMLNLNNATYYRYRAEYLASK